MDSARDINCIHFTNGGNGIALCAAGRYGGKTTYGTCLRHCTWREPVVGLTVGQVAHGVVARAKNALGVGQVATEITDGRGRICMECSHRVFSIVRRLGGCCGAPAETLGGNQSRRFKPSAQVLRRIDARDGIGFCDICTCSIAAKVKLASEKCPIGKW